MAATQCTLKSTHYKSCDRWIYFIHHLKIWYRIVGDEQIGYPTSAHMCMYGIRVCLLSDGWVILLSCIRIWRYVTLLLFCLNWQLYCCEHRSVLYAPLKLVSLPSRQALCYFIQSNEMRRHLFARTSKLDYNNIFASSRCKQCRCTKGSLVSVNATKARLHLLKRERAQPNFDCVLKYRLAGTVESIFRID